MAGIGFDLLKLWKQGTYQSLLRAYGMTTLMGSGPGLLIIIGIGVVCFFNLFATPSNLVAQQFLTIIIYLFSSSMILSSLFQYTFYRFIADKIYAKNFKPVTPNFIGAISLQLCISVCFSVPMVCWFFGEYSLIQKILLTSCFILLCLIWFSTVVLTGFKSYRQMIWAFVLGYWSMIVVHFLFEKNDLVFLLFQFLLAQAVIFICLLYAVLDEYPAYQSIKFDFLKKDNLYFSLILANFCYTLGIWIDKYLFWFNPDTGLQIIPPLRLSPIYDLPMFICYFTIIPTISVFMLQLEARFSLIYPEFMSTIFRKKTLAEIDASRDELVCAGRDVIWSLVKVQIAMTVIVFLSASFLFSFFKIPTIYSNLLFILVIAVGLNAILWGLLNILFYLTQHRQALCVSALFLVTNYLFTLISFHLGPAYFGYGFSFSLLLAIGCALIFLNKDFKNIEYSTFMMVE